jgi:hypothetical protein
MTSSEVIDSPLSEAEGGMIADKLRGMLDR